MKTLEEIDQLKHSRFGRPQPRHGLKLLYWFATDCLFCDQNNALQCRCYPGNGDFGFHLFENRYERNGGKLLPDVTFRYYAVGNLSKSGAYNLPRYVREHYTGFHDNSNMDRIIVSINNKWFHTVYITEHSDRSNFNKHATFRISRHLLMIIRELSLDHFLLRTGYLTIQANIHFPFPTSPSSNCFSAIPSSRNQDICIDIEPPPSVMNRNTQQQTTRSENQHNNSVGDIIIQIPSIPNLQFPSPENQPISTCTSTIMASRNKDSDIESAPVSQITDDTQNSSSICGARRRCYCTIL